MKRGDGKAPPRWACAPERVHSEWPRSTAGRRPTCRPFQVKKYASLGGYIKWTVVVRCAQGRLLVRHSYPSPNLRNVNSQHDLLLYPWHHIGCQSLLACSYFLNPAR